MVYGQKQINNNLTNGINIKNNQASHIPFTLDNNLINDRYKQWRNNSGNEKSKIKYKIIKNEEIKGNQSLLKKKKSYSKVIL